MQTHPNHAKPTEESNGSSTIKMNLNEMRKEYISPELHIKVTFIHHT